MAAPDPHSSLAPPVQTRVQTLPYGDLPWEVFERLCVRLAATEADVLQSRPYGVRGDEQGGIDVYAALHGGGYATYQCKNVKGFGPVKIRAAIDRFASGDWSERSDRFVLCTRESLAKKDRSDALEEGRGRLGRVALVAWDADALDALLKDHPRIVDDFFSRPWVTAFNGPEVAAALAREDHLRATGRSVAEIPPGLPPAVRDLVSAPVLDELSSLLDAGDAEQAHALAVRHARALDERLAADDPEDGVRDALRPYRQRLLFAASTSASWLGSLDAARAHARQALALGPVAAEYLPQATTALFNASLADDLRDLVTAVPDDGPEGAPERARARALLAYLEGDWATAEALLPDSESPDVLLMRAQARIARLDAADVDAVRDAAALLDAAEADPPLAVGHVLAASATADLLDRVLYGQTPLTFDRGPLVAAVRRRALQAIEEAPPGSPLRARAAGVVIRAAGLLRDPELSDRFDAELSALPPDVRAEHFVPDDPLPDADEVARLHADGRLDDLQAVLFEAAAHERAGDAAAADAALRRTLFASADDRRRTALLRALVRLRRRHGRSVDALLADVPVPEGDRWALRAETDEGVPDPDAAAAFPLHVGVVEVVADRLLTSAPGNDAQGPDAPSQRGDASFWTARLVQLLPTRTSRTTHAEALLREHRDEALLTATDTLDGPPSERLVGLRAVALERTGRRAEAVSELLAFIRRRPDAPRPAVHAAALLLRDGEAGEAARLLAPHVRAGDPAPPILVHYARALLAQSPTDPEAASRAFNLLAQAYDVDPSEAIANEAWKAARGAGRTAEAVRFFEALTRDAPVIDAGTVDSIDEAYAEAGSRLVHFTGGTDALVEHLRRDQERLEAIGRVSAAHGLAYADALRASGRPWPNWTRWTLRAAQAPGGDGHAVLVDWPSSAFAHARHHPGPAPSLFADPTALLTLGVLGPDLAAQILDAAGTLHVVEGTLDGLARDLDGAATDVLIGGASPSADAVERLRAQPDAAVPYTDALEAVAPEGDGLGAARVDLGAAALLGCPYVSDLDLPDAPDVVPTHVVLATLCAEGLVTAEDADRAAEARPGAFGAWRDADPLPALPDRIIVGPFAVADLEAVGALRVLGHRVRVGPWGWAHLLDEAERREAAVAAQSRLAGLLGVLRPRFADGRLVELAPVGGPCEPAGDGEGAIEAVWHDALVSLRTARHHGLQLWADDRFFPLLLWTGGPTFEGPEIERLRGELADWADDTPPIPTVEAVARAARDGHVPDALAEDVAATLFDAGYRPAHALVLAHAARTYPAASAPPLRGRFAALARAVEAVPSYLPSEMAPDRRRGFVRVAAVELAESFVAGAWSVPGLSDPARCTLADAFLAALERVYDAHSDRPAAPRSDRTRLLFWTGVLNALASLPADDPDADARRDRALEWLGDAAAARTETALDVVRLFEDYALYRATAVGDLRLPDGRPVPPQASGRFALTALVPLFQTGLLEHLDPLLRRAVGFLGGLVRGGRAEVTYRVEVGDQTLTTTVSDEEGDRAAADLLLRASHGDPRVAELVRGLDLDVTWRHPVPPDWVDAGVPADDTLPLPLRRSALTLLWAEPPIPDALRDLVVGLAVYTLATLDPDLALRVHADRDALTDPDADARRPALERLALAVLGSVYLDLRRDLGHAVWRLRGAEPDRLDRFVGWVGAEDAQALYDTEPHPSVSYRGAASLPMSHARARAALTDAFDDEPLLQAALGAGDLDDVPDWLANRAAIAETAGDPAVAAWALRQTLLVLRWLPDPVLIEVNGEALDAAEWAARHVLTVLDADPPAGSPRAIRRRLAAAAFRLALHACAGPAHVEAYDAEDDPLAELLDRVWLLQSRLVAALPLIHADEGAAADEADRAVRDLGLDDDTAGTFTLDAFDPFALGGAGDRDDVERVFTLAAVLRALPDDGPPPPWWTPALRGRVAHLAKTAPLAPQPPDGVEIGDRFGIGERLYTRPFAVRITAWDTRRDGPNDGTPTTPPEASQSAEGQEGRTGAADGDRRGAKRA